MLRKASRAFFWLGGKLFGFVKRCISLIVPRSPTTSSKCQPTVTDQQESLTVGLLETSNSNSDVVVNIHSETAEIQVPPSHWQEPEQDSELQQEPQQEAQQELPKEPAFSSPVFDDEHLVDVYFPDEQVVDTYRVPDSESEPDDEHVGVDTYLAGGDSEFDSEPPLNDSEPEDDEMIAFDNLTVVAKAAISAELNMLENLNWRIGAKLGQGAGGFVFQALRDERPCALKIMVAQYDGHCIGEKEVLAANWANSNNESAYLFGDFFITVKDQLDLDLHLHILELELMAGSFEGESFCDSDRFQHGHYAQVVQQVASGLAYMHHHRMVHGDVKPGNILRDEVGNAKLGDYGSSLSFFELERNQRQPFGTPAFFSPETVMQTYHELDERTAAFFDSPDAIKASLDAEKCKRNASIDVFALGCCAYEWALGEDPFYDAEFKWSKAFEDDRVAKLKCSTPMLDLIRSMLDNNPNKRPRAQEVVEFLEDITGFQYPIFAY